MKNHEFLSEKSLKGEDFFTRKLINIQTDFFLHQILTHPSDNFGRESLPLHSLRDVYFTAIILFKHDKSNNFHTFDLKDYQYCRYIGTKLEIAIKQELILYCEAFSGVHELKIDRKTHLFAFLMASSTLL